MRSPAAKPRRRRAARLQSFLESLREAWLDTIEPFRGGIDWRARGVRASWRPFRQLTADAQHLFSALLLAATGVQPEYYGDVGAAGEERHPLCWDCYEELVSFDLALREGDCYRVAPRYERLSRDAQVLLAEMVPVQWGPLAAGRTDDNLLGALAYRYELHWPLGRVQAARDELLADGLVRRGRDVVFLLERTVRMRLPGFTGDV